MREFKITIFIRPRAYMVLLAAVGLLAGLMLALLYTDTGRGVMAGIAAHIVEKRTGFECDIEGFDVDIGELKLSMAGLTLKDGGGIWLKAENVRMNWDRENLLGNNCSMESFESGPVTVMAIPEKSYLILNNLQSALFTSPLSIDRLRVPSVTFNPRVFGRELKVSLRGDCEYAGRNREYGVVGTSEKLVGEIRLQNLNDYRQEIQAASDNPDDIPPSVQSYARLSEEKGGVLSAYLGLPDTSPLEVDAVVPFRYRGVKDALIRLEGPTSSQLSFSGYVDGKGFVDYSGELWMSRELTIHGFVIPAEHYLYDIEFRPNNDWTKLDKVAAYLASEDKSEELFVSGSIALWNSRQELEFKGNLPLSSPLWQGETAGLKSDERSLITGSISGAFDNPDITLNVKAQEVSYREYRAAVATLGIGVKEYFNRKAGISVSASASLSGLEMMAAGGEGLLAIPDLAGSLKMEHLRGGRELWKVESFELAAGTNKVSLSGSWQPEEGRFSGRHQLLVNQMPEWLARNYRLPGPFAMHGNLSGTWRNDNPQSGELKGDATLELPAIDGLPQLFGSSAKLDFSLFRPGAGLPLELMEGRFLLEGIGGSLSGSIDPGNGAISLAGSFAPRDDMPYSKVVPERLKGSFEFGSVPGGLQLSVLADTSAFVLAGETVDDLRFELSARGGSGRLKGEAVSTFAREGGEVRLASPLELGLLYVELQQPGRVPSLKYRQPEIPEVDK